MQTEEEIFTIQQNKVRAAIKFQHSTHEPIDIIILNYYYIIDNNLKSSLPKIQVLKEYPYQILYSLDVLQLNTLKPQLTQFATFDQDPMNSRYFNLLLVICNHLISLKANSNSLRILSGITPEITNGINQMLHAYDYLQLCNLESEINQKLKSDLPTDVEYWHSALQLLLVQKAKLELCDIHKQLILKFKNHSSQNSSPVFKKPDEKIIEELEKQIPESQVPEPKASKIQNLTVNCPLQQTLNEYEKTLKIITIDDFNSKLDISRQIAAQNFKKLYMSPSNLESNWQDRFKPRKPTYLNKIHTGYVWNSYNRSHYTRESEPPKVVQGYKFNIFYPDLIDPSKIPNYQIIHDEGFPETVILKFIAGAPYEDIAFRIINSEWEYSHKRGFVCEFEKGVLRLWINFRKEFFFLKS